MMLENPGPTLAVSFPRLVSFRPSLTSPLAKAGNSKRWKEGELCLHSEMKVQTVCVLVADVMSHGLEDWLQVRGISGRRSRHSPLGPHWHWQGATNPEPGRTAGALRAPSPQSVPYRFTFGSVLFQIASQTPQSPLYILPARALPRGSHSARSSQLPEGYELVAFSLT